MLYYLDIKFEINLFSLFAFVMGIVSGLIIFGLLYLISSLNSLRKKKIKADEEVERISEEQIKQIINKYQTSYKDEKKRMKKIPIDFFKSSIWAMMNEIAKRYYPKSKRPLFELNLDEIILLDRYIIGKIEDLLSKRGLKIFRKLKVSTILKIMDAKTVVESNAVYKTAKKYKLKKIGDILSTILNVINPYMWVKKGIINPIINVLTNKVFLICYSIIGEETYKIYSKQVFVKENEELILLLDSLDKEAKEFENETMLLENQVSEKEI